ncbi:hypothetical protein OA92_13105 [Marinomonas sp. SBI22]|uniref:SRPBCC family protein n=1 Tax=unclassified Marinomonas TaxID=196814 RepID=UPI0007AFCFBC|nr:MULTISPECIES: SRPBCC family protein [unclassified Marinomonas]KZM42139.1 hypothetical protein OA92_13105 [Marinomonas sp. SBI22]KZM47017.1 hypothetical protein OA91_00300 [Marinomonas sp. SBI8L]
MRRNPDMKYYLQKSIMINATQEAVWAVISEFNNVYTWAPSVEHSTALNDKYQSVGSGRVCHIKGFGTVEETVTQWHEGKGFEFVFEKLGPMAKCVCDFSIEKVGNQQSKLTVTFQYTLRFGIFGSLLHALVLKNKLAVSLGHTIEALKTRIETGKLLRPLKPQKQAA